VNDRVGRNKRCAREHDVPYDPIRRRDRDERGDYITAASQQIHKPRLVVTAESTAVHLRDAGVVLGSLGTDVHAPRYGVSLWTGSSGERLAARDCAVNSFCSAMTV
jgi:hypothetical protein